MNHKINNRFKKKSNLQVDEINSSQIKKENEVEIIDDYMSDLSSFNLPQPSSNPQLSSQTNEPLIKKRKINELMKETREKGYEQSLLSTTINSKGLKLFQKFGYQIGEGLGKEGQGIQEPLQPTNRSYGDISGIGIFEIKQKQQQENKLKQLEILQNKNNQTKDLIQSYQQTQSQQYVLRRGQQQFLQLLQISVNLRQQPLMKPYSSLVTKDSSSLKPTQPLHALHTLQDSLIKPFSTLVSEDSNPIQPHQPLESTQQSSSPSSSSITSHPYTEQFVTYCQQTSQMISMASLSEMFPSLEKENNYKDMLYELSDYLRNNYCYCYFCQIQYEDHKDLFDNCPGKYEEDH